MALYLALMRIFLEVWDDFVVIKLSVSLKEMRTGTVVKKPDYNGGCRYEQSL